MSHNLDVMEETPLTTVTKEFVEERVRDWKNRLGKLFGDVQRWATKEGWQVDGSGNVRLHEELMRQFDVPSTDQPTLRLDRAGAYALFKPKGPWVIGANGRIDLYTSKGVFIIVDLAEYGSASQWTIFRTSQKREGETFTPEMISALA